MTRDQMEIRAREFWPLQDIQTNDLLVRRIVDSYVHGEIATLNEALFQIAIHCARSRDQAMDKVLLAARLGSWNPTIPQ